MNRKSIKLQARTTVQNNWLMGIALLLLPIAVQAVATMLLGWFFGIITFVVGAFIVIGYSNAFLHLYRKGEGRLEDLLYGVHHWQPTLILALWKFLFEILWLVAPMIVLVIGGLFLTGAIASGSTILTILVGLITLVAAISVSVIGFFIKLRYGFAEYILIENPTLNPKECIEESKRLMQGRYVELVVFYFSFFGWFLLSTVTFGLASLFTIPYLLTAYAGVYDSLKNQK
ncbi:MAG: DUF975 family protein [Culicoidibacterales bacterium]